MNKNYLSVTQHLQQDKVCGWTVHTNEFRELLLVLDTMGKSERDYESTAISFSSLHSSSGELVSCYPMQNMRGRIQKLKIMHNSIDPL